MEEEKDYYKILGVDRGASDEEVKKAFRRLVHEHHPDKHTGDKGKEEQFKVINEAYETLRDPEKRAHYDRYGYAAGAGRNFRGNGAANGPGGDFHDIFSEVFSDFFGNTRRGGPERGTDLRYDLEITFEEAAFGAEKPITIPRTIPCAICHGSGSKQGSPPQPCSTCRGAGQVRFQQGFFSITRTCGACNGAGVTIKDPCSTCRGGGKTRTQGTITVKIPPGVDTGSRLRLSNEGEHGERGGSPGDLYIVLTVRPHGIFKRQEDDIICEVPISFTQAALGAEIDVPAIEGSVRLKIPVGTQTGKTFRFKGKGIQSLQGNRRGDELVIVRVETPTRLTKRQKDLLQEFADMSGDDTTPEKKNFFSKVKEIFE